MTENVERIVIVDNEGIPLRAPQKWSEEAEAAEDVWLAHVGQEHPEVWDTTLPAPSGHEPECLECRRLRERVDLLRPPTD